MVRDSYADHIGAGRVIKAVAIFLFVAFILWAGYWLLSDDDRPPLNAEDFRPTSTRAAIDDSAAASAGSVAGSVGSSATTSTSVSRVGATSTSTSTSAAPTSVASTSVAPTSSVAVAPPATSAASTTAAAAAGYPTSEDGTPLPILVTYDADTITITGFVPSQAAKDRLGALALANSKTEAQLENNLVINPDVPIGVGVRVMELNSARFPEGSAELLPDHANEFRRVADFMIAVPNVTALVIGHADQRGDEESNYEISAERAQAVVEFLTYLGVSPTRLSSRAVGEADLLTLGDDDTALALNRRTEFIFYGLLVE